MSDQTKYTSTLESKRILVIGGTSGLGFCVAEACIEHGALVTIASSSRERVDGAVEKIEDSYPSSGSANGKRRIWGTTVDLGHQETLEKELKGVLEKAVEVMGGGGEKLDHVVFTAGDRLASMAVEDMTIESILAAGQIRFFAPLLLAKFLPQYLNSPSSSSPSSSYTITTGSVSEKPIPNWSVIAAYAGGLHAMVKGLALDLKPIRVNAVSPGLVQTELWDHLGDKKSEALEGMARGLPTGRAGRPESVAQSFLGIMRDDNMDGTVVRSDGGGLLV